MLDKVVIQSFSTDDTKKYEVEVGMARYDLFHPIVSGNKYFKLKYYLVEAIATQKNKIATMGGYYSNHLIATAYAAKEAGLMSVGLVRGEEPRVLSDTLKDCLAFGMELQFLSRIQFDEFHPSHFRHTNQDCMFIPQGGFGPLGIKGAASMMDINGIGTYDTIVAAAGTGTMAAGLISKLQPHQCLEIISVLKGNHSLEYDIRSLLSLDEQTDKNFNIHHEFHEGGYARYSKELLNCMNQFYCDVKIPTDFVYTGKLIKAFFSLLKSNAKWHGKKVLIVHSGGLQGNRSLLENELMF